MKNYFLFVLPCIIFLSCKTKSQIITENKDIGGFLLVPEIEKKEFKKEERFIIYKDIDLIRKIDIKNDSFNLILKNEVIFKGDIKCNYIIEVFDKSVIVISKSNYESNKYISAYHSYIRDEIYFFDIEKKNKGKLKLDSPVYIFPIKTSNVSTENDQFFIKKIDLVKKQIIFIDSSNNEKSHQLRAIEHLPVTCQ